MIRFVRALTCAVSLLALAPCVASADEVNAFSNADGLERIDAQGLRSCVGPLDLAAFVLTDWALLDAIGAKAAGDPSPVRVYLDPSQAANLDGRSLERMSRLASMPNVSIKVKANGPYMHEKRYLCGDVLRTGSANFSVSALRDQDNDILLVRSARVVGSFRGDFEAMWQRRDNRDFRDFVASGQVHGRRRESY